MPVDKQEAPIVLDATYAVRYPGRMNTQRRYKPGASRRERSAREHGKWVSRPYGTKTRETRNHDRHVWTTDQEPSR